MSVKEHNDFVSAELPSGDSVKVVLWGATVISWKAKGQERFFVSSKALLDGSKPVRGGIPIAFPIFGAASRPEHSKLPSHGFARSSKWEFKGSEKNDQAVVLSFALGQSPEIQEKYNFEFNLKYTVSLHPDSLKTELTVENPKSSTMGPLHFQALLHNYLAASPTSSVRITPLTGLAYVDKMKGGETATEDREKVDVKITTDRVYANALGEYKMESDSGGLEVKTENFPDVVVWNPHEELGAEIGDMEDQGWEKFVCLEPGHVSGFQSIDAGESWTASQTFTPL